MNKCRKNNNRFKKLKIKIKKREKENSPELQKPNVEQRFITTITSVTEYTHIHIHT